MQKTKELEIGGAKFTVKRIGWGSWCDVKDAIVDAIDVQAVSDLLAALGDALQLAQLEGRVGELTGGDFLRPDILKQVPGSLPAIARALRHATPAILHGCVVETVDLDELDAAEVMQLRDAAVQFNGFPELLAQEGNLLGSLMATVQGTSEPDAGGDSQTDSDT